MQLKCNLVLFIFIIKIVKKNSSEYNSFFKLFFIY